MPWLGWDYDTYRNGQLYWSEGRERRRQLKHQPRPQPHNPDKIFLVSVAMAAVLTTRIVTNEAATPLVEFRQRIMVRIYL